MLIGRDAERRALAQLAAAARVSESHALLLVGEAGLGKTALLDDLAQQATGLRVLRVSGSEAERELAFGGLDQLLRPLLDHLGDVPERQAHALEVALALAPGDPADRFAVSAATLSLLGRAAEEQPVLVLVDDAHALDRPSCEALAFVCRRVLADPLAVVAATRPAQHALTESGLPRVDLDGLATADVAALLAAHAHAPVPPELADRVRASTDGNPLAVVELAGSLDQLERLTPAAPISVPDRVRAEYVRRTGTLTPEARWSLLVASVASEGTLAASALTGLGVTLEQLRSAESAGLVRLRPGRVEFRHPLVRAGVYAAASPQERRSAHRAVAAATSDPDRRAWHLGEAAVGLDDEVAAEVTAAALRSRGRGAYSVAATGFERAAALTSLRDRRADRLFSAGEAALLAGQGSRAAALLDEAAAERVDSGHAGRIDALRAVVEQRWGSLERSRELGLRALDALVPQQPDAAVDAASDLVATSFHLCDAELAGRLATLTERLAERASAPERSRALLASGLARILAGGSGAEQIRTAMEVMADDEETDGAALRPTLLVVGPLFVREQSRSAHDLVEKAVRRLREGSALGPLASLLFHVARYSASTDQWDAAAGHYQEGISLARESGQSTDLAMLLAGLAWLQARTGVEDGCRTHAAEALVLAERHHVHMARVWATYALGDLHLALGRPAEALVHYRALEAFLARIRFRDVDVSPLPEVVECLHRAGRDAEALREAESYRTRAEAKGQTWALARAARACAVVSDDPGTGLQQALDLHAAGPDLFEEARTRLALGEVLRRTRRRTLARSHLRTALESFERLGARPWADRTAAELRATGERPRRRGDRNTDVLTPQELQVARLLSSGHTTRAAAASLFLSPKTVEYHLRHVYMKLDVNNRGDLARALSSSGSTEDDTSRTSPGTR